MSAIHLFISHQTGMDMDIQSAPLTSITIGSFNPLGSTLSPGHTHTHTQTPLAHYVKPTINSTENHHILFG